MGYEAKQTEHCGPKRGNGAYWGYKWEAKKESNRIRRENWKREPGVTCHYFSRCEASLLRHGLLLPSGDPPPVVCGG